MSSIDPTARDSKEKQQEAGLLVRDVTVAYSNGHEALTNARFETPAGSITALVGMNGSGKSTLFKAIMGFVPLVSGSISIMGFTAREALRRKLIAYVPQSEEVDWDFPVLVQDVVMMGRYGHMNWLRRPKSHDHEAVEMALEQVGMQALRSRQIGELSGGQRKRVFLARALAQQARVILLDEPFTGVDVGTEDDIITLLRQLRERGHLILVSTHNLGSVPEFCDHAVLLKRSVLAYGITADVFTRDNLSRAFGGVLRHFIIDERRDIGSGAVGIYSDDERPLVFYGDTATARSRQDASENAS